MSDAMTSLITIMQKLRDPDTGCPWDVKQTFETIAPYTIEEAYEVDDAIKSGDRQELKEELGDLLLQVVFHAQIASEEGSFTFDDVAEAICRKMITRHPHVFDTGKEGISSDDVRTNWETLKEQERQQKRQKKGQDDPSDQPSALDGVASSLPALMRAQKLQKRAACVGFDWPAIIPVIDKIKEEAQELSDAYMDGSNPDHIAEEYGDLLFVMVNLGRHLKLDVETTLRHSNDKFTRRFKAVEQSLQDQGYKLEECELDQMDAVWNQIKELEKNKA